MLRIQFLTIDRFKSNECETLFQYYLKLASRFAEVLHTELSLGKKQTSADSALSRWLESRGSRVHLTLLDERGKQFSSREWSARIEKIRDSSSSEWVIAVGSAHGYGEELRKKADLLWSLSALTFPHELAAAVAAEQIYRGLSILNKHPYHND